MDLDEKLSLLGGGARYDISCACGGTTGRRRGALDRWIYPAVLPDGRRAPLLKILLSNACVKDCGYCENRSGRDFRRASFAPDDLAGRFVDLQRSGDVTGIFLSSAISGNAVATMDRMIATAEIIRRRHGFRGYLHLKILPGAQEAQVERAGWLATRVSINLEVPDRKYLGVIAPGKHPDEILQPLRWIRKCMDRDPGRWAPSGFTTQFVVGAAGEMDREIMGSAWALYRKAGAQRIYFSAFQPVEGTPLDSLPPCPAWREHRLYQCDFLMRKYGFSFDEIVFDEKGDLMRDEDPKTAWARTHRDLFPLEVNSAPPELLLRVPGIGPSTARKIARARREGKIGSPEHLAKMGASMKRAAPYLIIGGRSLPVQIEML